MTTKLIAISIGNSRTQIGAFEDGQLRARHVAENHQDEQVAQFLESAFGPPTDSTKVPVVVASVNPVIEQRFTTQIGQKFGIKPLIVERDLPVPIGRQLDRETIVGVDRLLNAAAAYDVMKQALVVVDVGTAITIDFVDGAGTFHGGAIAPGAQMMLDAMHQGTSQLPQIHVALPDEPIGHSTAQAMLAGVYYGVRGMVRELVEQYAQVAGVYPVVVVTGGDAQLLFGQDELVERMVEELTLRGIALAFQTQVAADP